MEYLSCLLTRVTLRKLALCAEILISTIVLTVTISVVLTVVSLAMLTTLLRRISAGLPSYSRTR